MLITLEFKKLSITTVLHILELIIPSLSYTVVLVNNSLDSDTLVNTSSSELYK